MLDLIRIKILSEAGVPLARIDEVLSSEPEQLAESVAHIDKALQQQIRELQRRRRRIADLAGGERMFLPAELVGFLDDLRTTGVSARTVQIERDGWILLMARYPQRALDGIREKRANLADPEFQQLYRDYGQAGDWEPTDRRLKGLADSMVRYLEQRCEEAVTPNWDLDDPTVAALLASHFGNASSPARSVGRTLVICTGGWPNAAWKL